MAHRRKSTVERKAFDAARSFGSSIRNRRQALKLSQNQLALATGVGRRFLIDLEGGKATCQLGRCLLVAETLGLRTPEITSADMMSQPTIPDLPDLSEEHDQNG